MCGGLLVNSDLTKWKENDRLSLLKCSHMRLSTRATRYLLYVNTSPWIHEDLKTYQHSDASHLRDVQTNHNISIACC